eukprot:scaffold12591_cov102-Isochrysis_galbana.AAC.5
MDSSTPHESASLKNLSEGTHLDPKADALSVMFSLVCGVGGKQPKPAWARAAQREARGRWAL